MVEISGIKYDVGALERIHSSPETSFLPIIQKYFPHAKLQRTPDNRQLIYVDNGKKILGVAHLDGTMPATHFGVGTRYNAESNKHHTVIFSPFVDDRLGVFTLLELLPQLDIQVDLLFSVGEEIGNPTSRFFNPPRQYNWMFQFDRRGTDAVCYQYNGEKWLESLTKSFGTIYVGAFSDISYMSFMGCQGVNIGTGYYDYTTPAAWASLHDLTSQLYKFEEFYDANYDKYYVFDSEAYYRTLRRNAVTKGKKHSANKIKKFFRYK